MLGFNKNLRTERISTFHWKQINGDLKKLYIRLFTLIHDNNIGHVGTSASALGVLYAIFKNRMNKDDIFILSSGHAALAYYVILEYMYGIDALMLYKKHGVHPHRDEENKIYCSTGSLGMGISVATGRAMINKNRKVHVLISDGEAAEGIVWESLKTIHENGVQNINVYVNVNGVSAYKVLDVDYLCNRLMSFLPDERLELFFTSVNLTETFKGLDSHYKNLDDDTFNDLMYKLQ